VRAAITSPAKQNRIRSNLPWDNRFNPNLPSPLLEVLTGRPIFSITPFQFLCFATLTSDHVSWQAYYNVGPFHLMMLPPVLFIEAVNEPPGSQNIFDRKGSRGRSSFRYPAQFRRELWFTNFPFGRGSHIGGWEISGVASVHSNVPFTSRARF